MRAAIEAPRPAIALAVALAAVTTCHGGAKQPFTHRVSIASEGAEPLFGFAVDAHGERVVVGDDFDHCEPDRSCDGTVRIFRVRGDKLVEETRFHGDENYLGEAVAMHGDRVAALGHDDVHIFKRGNAGWAEVAIIGVDRCGGKLRPDGIALDEGTLLVHGLDSACIWELRDGAWELTARLDEGRFNIAEPAIGDGVVAVPSYDGDEVALFARGPNGWEKRATVAIAKPFRVALAKGVLAVESADRVHVFDVTAAPRRMATLAAQTRQHDSFFGSELELDGATLAAWAEDGVHVWRRRGDRWEGQGVVGPWLPQRQWFGARLAFAGSWLWIGDPDMRDEEHRAGGYVHGYRR